MTKEIILTKGYKALVDDEDFERINEHSWFAIQTATGPNSIHVHAARWLPQVGPKRVCRRMHYEVLEAEVKTGLLLDHFNRNGIDNQKENLVWSTKRENALNSDRVINAKFIYYDKSRDRYKAFGSNRFEYVGTFKTLIEAEEARRAYSQKY